MPDLANESTSINYAKRDASAERLWLTQRKKVNPWDRRSDEGPGQGPSGSEDGASADKEAPLKTMIAQQDVLKLESLQVEFYENPFEILIDHAHRK